MYKLEAGRVSLKSMDFYGYHGCLPEERKVGQHYFVDADFYFDIAAAASSDDLSLTVDYAKAFDIARGIVEGPSRNLIESLANEIAAKLMLSFGPKRVAVRVRKPYPPVGGKCEYAEAEAVLTNHGGRKEGKRVPCTE